MGAVHFQSRHWFCLTAGGKDNSELLLSHLDV